MCNFENTNELEIELFLEETCAVYECLNIHVFVFN